MVVVVNMFPQAGLESLYEANRGNAMKTVQGWPVASSYLTSTTGSSSLEQRDLKAVNLSSDQFDNSIGHKRTAYLPDDADRQG